MGLGVIVMACSAATAGHAHTPKGARGGEPLARSGATTQEVIETRTRFFGARNVDQRTGALARDKVILSWFGVTNFAMSIRGHVVLLDAWVPRGAHSGYVPTTPDELARLLPETIFLGHAHFDHGADAVPIAQASGATIVGTAEHCAAMATRATQDAPRCISLTQPNAAPGTTTTRTDLIDGVEVKAMKHLHSAISGNDRVHVPVIPLPSTTSLERPPTVEDLVQLLSDLPDAEGGSVLYRFEVGGFSMVWNDSAGPLIDKSRGTLGNLRTFRPVDVQVGAIQGFNQFSNGLRDPVQYIDTLEPDLFVPSHHDDWAAGITTKGERYREPFTQELQRIPADRRPDVRFITDPADYIKPDRLTFDAPPPKPTLTRRCTSKGLRVRLAGDTADVTNVTYKLGTRTRRATTGDVTFPKRTRGTKLRAQVTFTDGTTTKLTRTTKRC